MTTADQNSHSGPYPSPVGMDTSDPPPATAASEQRDFRWSNLLSFSGPPPHPTLHCDRATKVVVAAIMVAMATLVTVFDFQLIFGIQLIFGSAIAYLALFLLRGWWGVVVMLSALYTVLKWGHPFSFLIFIGELIGATLFCSAGNERLLLRKGRIIWYSLLYWAIVGIPLSYLCHHYFLGLTPLFATTNAFKQAINAAINVSIAYGVYTVFQLWMNRRSGVPATMIAVRGLILINSFLLILVPSLVFVVQISNYRVAELSRHINTEYTRYADALTHKRIAAPQLRQLENLHFRYTDPQTNSLVITSPELFNRVSSFQPAPLNIPDPVSKTLVLMWPADAKIPLLARFQRSYWRYCPNETGRAAESCRLMFLEKGMDDVQYLMEASKDDFIFYFFLLFIFACLSEALAFLVEREFIVILPPSLIAVDGLADQPRARLEARAASISALPTPTPKRTTETANGEVLRYSPISELSQAIAIINSNIRQIRDDKDRIQALNAIAQRQLTTAGQIQKSFLVNTMPRFANYDFASYISPAYDAGGDWYDYCATDEFALVVVADVCDKGVGSALFMSVFRSLIHFYVSSNPPGDTPLEDYMRNLIFDVNEYMSRNHGDAVMFATIFAAIVAQSAASSLTYVCAGHESPVIRCPDGSMQHLKVTGPSVGLFPGIEFQAETVPFPPGSLLFAYTDGVTDARSQADESFGIKRLTSLIEQIQPEELSAAAVVTVVCESLKLFMGSAEQFDDITCVCVMSDRPDPESASKAA
ncbi:MAG: PP2C family protein-serine/threonine phosphatase [Vulcanococcus sp.]